MAFRAGARGGAGDSDDDDDGVPPALRALGLGGGAGGAGRGNNALAAALGLGGLGGGGGAGRGAAAARLAGLAGAGGGGGDDSDDERPSPGAGRYVLGPGGLVRVGSGAGADAGAAARAAMLRRALSGGGGAGRGGGGVGDDDDDQHHSTTNEASAAAAAAMTTFARGHAPMFVRAGSSGGGGGSGSADGRPVLSRAGTHAAGVIDAEDDALARAQGNRAGSSLAHAAGDGDQRMLQNAAMQTMFERNAWSPAQVADARTRIARHIPVVSYRALWDGKVAAVDAVGGGFGSVWFSAGALVPIDAAAAKEKENETKDTSAAVQVPSAPAVNAAAAGPFAVKELKQPMPGDLEREVELMLQFRNSPHVARICAITLSPPALILEHCSYGSVHTVLEEDRGAAASAPLKSSHAVTLGSVAGSPAVPVPLPTADFKSDVSANVVGASAGAAVTAAVGSTSAASIVGGPKRPRRAPLTVLQKLAIAMDLCAAVDTLHAQGLVHRDVKPANLLLTESLRGKLSDFGTCCTADECRNSKAGTIVYNAPEVNLVGNSTHADVYSLGVSLYEVFAGKMPFSNTEILASLRGGSLQLEPALAAFKVAPATSLVVESELRRIIAQCARLDPRTRPTARVVRAAIATLYSHVKFGVVSAAPMLYGSFSTPSLIDSSATVLVLSHRDSPAVLASRAVGAESVRAAVQNATALPCRAVQFDMTDVTAADLTSALSEFFLSRAALFVCVYHGASVGRTGNWAVVRGDRKEQQDVKADGHGSSRYAEFSLDSLLGVWHNSGASVHGKLFVLSDCPGSGAWANEATQKAHPIALQTSTPADDEKSAVASATEPLRFTSAEFTEHWVRALSSLRLRPGVKIPTPARPVAPLAMQSAAATCAAATGSAPASSAAVSVPKAYVSAHHRVPLPLYADTDSVAQPFAALDVLPYPAQTEPAREIWPIVWADGFACALHARDAVDHVLPPRVVSRDAVCARILQALDDTPTPTAITPIVHVHTPRGVGSTTLVSMLAHGGERRLPPQPGTVYPDPPARLSPTQQLSQRVIGHFHVDNFVSRTGELRTATCEPYDDAAELPSTSVCMHFVRFVFARMLLHVPLFAGKLQGLNLIEQRAPSLMDSMADGLVDISPARTTEYARNSAELSAEAAMRGVPRQVILIDGIDLHAPLQRLLRAKAHQFPPWLCWVVTSSGPSAQLPDLAAHTSPAPAGLNAGVSVVTTVDLNQKTDAAHCHADVMEYIRTELERPAWAVKLQLTGAAATAAHLVTLTGGNFAHAAQLLHALTAPGALLPAASATSDSLSAAQFKALLHGLYTAEFMRRFSGAAAWQRHAPLFAMLCASAAGSSGAGAPLRVLQFGVTVFHAAQGGGDDSALGARILHAMPFVQQYDRSEPPATAVARKSHALVATLLPTGAVGSASAAGAKSDAAASTEPHPAAAKVQQTDDKQSTAQVAAARTAVGFEPVHEAWVCLNLPAIREWLCTPGHTFSVNVRSGHALLCVTKLLLARAPHMPDDEYKSLAAAVVQLLYNPDGTSGAAPTDAVVLPRVQAADPTAVPLHGVFGYLVSALAHLDWCACAPSVRGAIVTAVQARTTISVCPDFVVPTLPGQVRRADLITALHWAARVGAPSAVAAMAQVDRPSLELNSANATAAICGVSANVTVGRAVSADNKFVSAWVDAASSALCYCNDVATARVLLDAGAHPLLTGAFYAHTPVYIVARRNRVPVLVELLKYVQQLAAGAARNDLPRTAVRALTGVVGPYGRTLLHVVRSRYAFDAVTAALAASGSSPRAAVSPSSRTAGAASQSIFGACDSYQNSPLHTACRYAHSEVVSAMLQAAAESAASDGASALSLVARAANSPNRFGRTPLMEAALRDDHKTVSAVVQSLCAHGVTAVGLDVLGDTVLHIMARNGHEDALHSLLSTRAECKTLIDAPNKRGLTPLLVSASQPVAEELLRAGANAQQRDEEGNTHLHLVMARDADGEEGDVLLAGALARANDVNAVNQAGQHALQVAASVGRVQTLLRLARADAKRPLKLPADDSAVAGAAEPLLVRRCCADDTTPTLLLGAGHSVLAIASADHQTALHRMAHHGGATRSLLADSAITPAFVNAQDNGGRTALHVAVAHDCAESVAALLTAGANPTLRTTSGLTPLHCARSVAAQRLLLSAAGKSADAADTDGDTPLHMAAARGDPALVQALLAAGVAPGVTNAMQQPPVFVARTAAIITQLTDGAAAREHALKRDVFGGTLLHAVAERGDAAALDAAVRCFAPATDAEASAGAQTEPNTLAGALGTGNGRGDSVAMIILRRAADPLTQLSLWQWVLTNASTAPALNLELANADGETALHLTVQATTNALTLTQRLLEHTKTKAGASVNAPDKRGLTALHHCTLAKVAQLLLNHNAGANSRDSQGNTPLHTLATRPAAAADPRLWNVLTNSANYKLLNARGRSALQLVETIEGLNALLDAGADIKDTMPSVSNMPGLSRAGSLGGGVGFDPRGMGDSSSGGGVRDGLLLRSPFCDDPILVRRMCDARFSLRERHSKTGLPPLLTTTNPECMRILLERGADINGAGPDNASALHLAVNRDDLEAVAVLVRCGSDLNAVSRAGLPVVHLIRSAAALKLLLQLPRPTSTSSSSSRLMARGLDVNLTDSQARDSALARMAAAPRLGPLHALLAAGANVMTMSQEFGRNPMFHSHSALGSQLLLTYGSRHDGLDKSGVHAVSFLSGLLEVEAVHQILAHVARYAPAKLPVHWADARGRTPLVAANARSARDTRLYQPSPWSHQGAAGYATKLFCAEYGANAAHAEADSETILHNAARCGKAEAVNTLLLFGAKVDQQSAAENTALILAKGLPAYRLLIDAGASLAVNARGNSILDPLCGSSRTDVVSDAASVRLILSRYPSLVRTQKQKLSLSAVDSIERGVALLRVVQMVCPDAARVVDSAGDTLLHHHPYRDHVELARLLCAMGVDPNTRNGQGKSALHVVRNSTVADFLIRHANANPNVADDSGRTPLHDAVEGRYPSVHVLLAHGGKADAKTAAGRTPLHFARSSVQARALLTADGGARALNTPDSSGDTPLILVLKEAASDLDLLRLLLEHGADVNVRSQGTPAIFLCRMEQLKIILAGTTRRPDLNVFASNGDSLLHLESVSRDPIWAKALCVEFQQQHPGNGPRLWNHQNKAGKTPLMCAKSRRVAQLYVEFKADVKLQDKAGRTALLSAVEAGDIDFVQMLLAADASVASVKDRKDQTALHLCTDPMIMRLLLSLPSAQSLLEAADSDGATPLLRAASQPTRAGVDICKQLLKRGSNPNAVDYAGKRVAHCAQVPELALALLQDPNFDATVSDAKGDNLLHYSAFNTYPQLVKMLCDKGLNVNQCSPGTDPLHMKSKVKEVIMELLTRGADGNARDKSGYTLLHRAVASDQFDIVRLLIDKGADFGVRNNVGELAAHLVRTSQMVNLIRTRTDLTLVDGNGRSLLFRLCADPAPDPKERELISHLAAFAPVNVVEKRGRSLLECVGTAMTARLLMDTGKLDLANNTRLRTLLHCAPWNMDVDLARRVAKALSAANALNTLDVRGRTAVHTVRRSDVLSMLLKEFKFDLNAQDNSGSTALHLAVAEGRWTHALELIRAGTNVNVRNVRGQTPLLRLCRVTEHNSEVFEALLNAGADVNVPDTEGYTPMFWLAFNSASDLNVITRLCSGNTNTTTAGSGSRLDLSLAAADSGWTPLFAARDVDVARILLQSSSAASMRLDGVDKYGRTLLHESVYQTPELARTLVRRGCDVNAVDHNGLTPLVQYLLTSVMALVSGTHAQTAVTSNDSLAAMLGGSAQSRTQAAAAAVAAAAVGRVDHDFVRVMVDELGAAVDVPSTSPAPPYTALRLAAALDDAKLVDLLLARKSDVHRVCRDGCRALHVARSQAVAERLLNAGADVNANSPQGTALIIAAKTDAVDYVNFLLSAKVGAKADLLPEPNKGAAPDRKAEAAPAPATDTPTAATASSAADRKSGAPQKHPHPLVAGADPYGRGAGFRCDVCRESYDASAVCYHCPPCGYDECESCHAAQDGGSGTARELDTVKRLASLPATPADWTSAAIHSTTSPLIVAKLLTAGASVAGAAVHRHGETLLHAKHVQSDAALLERLCTKAGVDVNARDTHGRTPLTCALALRNASAVAVLLKCGANPNTPQPKGAHTRSGVQEGKGWTIARASDGRSFLVRTPSTAASAARAASRSITAVQLSDNGTLSSTPMVGVSMDLGAEYPLHLAVESTQPALVELLLRYGANPLLSLADGRTPLHCCTNEDVCRLLLRFDYTKRVKPAVGSAGAADAVDAKALPTATALLAAADLSGDTPLHAAVSRHAVDIIEAICNSGAGCNPNARNIKGVTPYMLANYAREFALLLSSGADPNAMANDGCGLPHLLAGLPAQTYEEQVSRATSVPVVAEGSLLTPLHLVQSPATAEAILRRFDVDVNGADALGNTPLHHACLHANIEMARWLIRQRKAQIRLNRAGQTPFHFVSRTAEWYELAMTPELRFDLNARDTALQRVAFTHTPLCTDDEELERAMEFAMAPERQWCTFVMTGRHHVSQRTYRCDTCSPSVFGPANQPCVCAVCAVRCHKGHKLRLSAMLHSGFCDCGSGMLSVPCTSCGPLYTNTTACTAQSGSVHQPMYQCRTCYGDAPVALCFGCCKTCHLGHAVTNVLASNKQLQPLFYRFQCDCAHGPTLLQQHRSADRTPSDSKAVATATRAPAVCKCLPPVTDEKRRTQPIDRSAPLPTALIPHVPPAQHFCSTVCLCASTDVRGTLSCIVCQELYHPECMNPTVLPPSKDDSPTTCSLICHVCSTRAPVMLALVPAVLASSPSHAPLFEPIPVRDPSNPTAIVAGQSVADIRAALTVANVVSSTRTTTPAPTAPATTTAAVGKSNSMAGSDAKTKIDTSAPPLDRAASSSPSDRVPVPLSGSTATAAAAAAAQASATTTAGTLDVKGAPVAAEASSAPASSAPAPPQSATVTAASAAAASGTKASATSQPLAVIPQWPSPSWLHAAASRAVVPAAVVAAYVAGRFGDQLMAFAAEHPAAVTFGTAAVGALVAVAHVLSTRRATVPAIVEVVAATAGPASASADVIAQPASAPVAAAAAAAAARDAPIVGAAAAAAVSTVAAAVPTNPTPVVAAADGKQTDHKTQTAAPTPAAARSSPAPVVDEVTALIEAAAKANPNPNAGFNRIRLSYRISTGPCTNATSRPASGATLTATYGGRFVLLKKGWEKSLCKCSRCVALFDAVGLAHVLGIDFVPPHAGNEDGTAVGADANTNGPDIGALLAAAGAGAGGSALARAASSSSGRPQGGSGSGKGGLSAAELLALLGN